MGTEKFAENTGLKRLVLKVIEGAIVEELLNDPIITDERRDICSACGYMDSVNCMCMKCGCFLVLKTKSKVNKNILTGKSEITHCPLNKWLDEFSKAGFELAKNN